MATIESKGRNHYMPDQNPGCLAAILSLFRGRRAVEEGPAEPMPYHLRDDFLSDAEASFYRVLHSMMGERFLVFPKVGLEDIFFVSRPNENAGARNRIDRKHLDFLICDAGTLDPVFGIELDDSSHQNSKRVAGDMFKDEVFETAGLPLVRVPVRRSYDAHELGALFRGAMSRSADREEPEIHPLEAVQSADASLPMQAAAPLCPKCGVPMVLRTSGRGAHVGERFYGCTNYPRCKSILPYDRHEIAPV